MFPGCFGSVFCFATSNHALQVIHIAVKQRDLASVPKPTVGFFAYQLIYASLSHRETVSCLTDHSVHLLLSLVSKVIICKSCCLISFSSGCLLEARKDVSRPSVVIISGFYIVFQLPVLLISVV